MASLKLRPTRNKSDSLNKTIYIPRAFVERIDEIATTYNTSFNNVVISMLAPYMQNDIKFEMDS